MIRVSSFIAQAGRRLSAALAIAGMAVTAGALGILPAAAAQWTIDPAESRIGFSGTHAGTAFSGTFETWSAKIVFDPADPTGGSAVATFETASAKTGNALYDGTLPGADWFDVANHPTASFQATGFEAVDGGQFIISGDLTIKEVTQPVTFTFALEADGARATATGEVVLDRLAFGLGVKPDPSAAWVSREIALDLRVVATRN